MTQTLQMQAAKVILQTDKLDDMPIDYILQSWIILTGLSEPTFLDIIDTRDITGTKDSNLISLRNQLPKRNLGIIAAAFGLTIDVNELINFEYANDDDWLGCLVYCEYTLSEIHELLDAGGYKDRIDAYVRLRISILLEDNRSWKVYLEEERNTGTYDDYYEHWFNGSDLHPNFRLEGSELEVYNKRQLERDMIKTDYLIANPLDFNIPDNVIFEKVGRQDLLLYLQTYESRTVSGKVLCHYTWYVDKLAIEAEGDMLIFIVEESS